MPLGAVASDRERAAEAYEAYLRGVSHVYKLSRADLDRSLEYFERALTRAPNFASAHVGIARVWIGRQQMQYVTPDVAAPHVRAANARALELDDTLAEVHFGLASQYGWTDWNWEAAEPAFKRAIELRPNYADARAFYSHFLYLTGRRDEALEQIEHAIDLDPMNDLIQALSGVVLTMERRYDEAIGRFRKALETAPTNPVALNGLARALHHAGRYEEAYAAERAVWVARGDAELEAALARGHAEGGYRHALRRAADTLAVRSAKAGSAPLFLALLYLRAGDVERGMDWAERSFKARDPNVPYIGIGPNWDQVRGHPRLEAVRRNLKLPN